MVTWLFCLYIFSCCSSKAYLMFIISGLSVDHFHVLVFIQINYTCVIQEWNGPKLETLMRPGSGSNFLGLDDAVGITSIHFSSLA